MGIVGTIARAMSDGSCSANFPKLFAEGDRSSLLHVLQYLLTDIVALQKRAYLVPFLSPVDIPPEFMQDQDVSNLSQKCKELQAEFIEVHKKVEEVRNSSESLAGQRH